MAAQSFLSESVLGWSIFSIVLLAILAFCWIYIRKFQSRQESEVVSTITAICALAIALITSALLPVDIFLVSFMKHPNGTYKDWAANNETREQIENTVLHGYYSNITSVCFLYYFIVGMKTIFILCSDDFYKNKLSFQVKNALKYTVGFAIVCVVLLLIGAFVPLEAPPSQNSTQWEKVQYLFEELGSSHGLPALAFSISSLTLIGMLAVITYTAYGMSVMPLNLIKGTRSVLYERLENTEDIDDVEHQIEKLKSKCQDGRPLSSRDRHNLQELESKLQVLRRRGRHLEIAERNCCTKVGSALRPIKVFPLDYILITVITMYFVFTSMAGIRNMGIWFFWIRLYKIRPKRTRPQALLFLCMILLLIVLHTSYMIYSLAPQYVMYGSQKYLVQIPSGNTTTDTTRTCDADAPEDQCTMTRTYLFLHKFWFFSTIYYFGNWAFIGAFLIGLVVSCCKGKKSVIEGEVEADDSDISDDEYVH
ncbi:putative lysosomal cobalamin transporter [Oryzias melastigma]|uniref:Lysosomal cobalamin transport escort protein LMBD1 n=1 Tax=Oryzias melastigma TaxID=30732 RepID=A0A834FAF0_ORYME|nr:putative lysosomal cobalamin transporter [Oryzias melastigma]